jgi:hypothetical protein
MLIFETYATNSNKTYRNKNCHKTAIVHFRTKLFFGVKRIYTTVSKPGSIAESGFVVFRKLRKIKN